MSQQSVPTLHMSYARLEQGVPVGEFLQRVCEALFPLLHSQLSCFPQGQHVLQHLGGL